MAFQRQPPDTETHKEAHQYSSWKSGEIMQGITKAKSRTRRGMAIALSSSVGLLILGTTTTAMAATSATSAPAACSQTSLGTVHQGAATGWLRYNTCSRNVWGKMSAPAKVVDWWVWVYNENTGKSEGTWDTGGTVLTKAISDAGTKSHVCIQSYHKGTSNPAGSKRCTGYH